MARYRKIIYAYNKYVYTDNISIYVNKKYNALNIKTI